MNQELEKIEKTQNVGQERLRSPKTLDESVTCKKYNFIFVIFRA